VKFINSNGIWSIEYTVGGLTTTVVSSYSITANCIMRFQIGSGDGGYTSQNGSGSFSVDYFRIK